MNTLNFRLTDTKRCDEIRNLFHDLLSALDRYVAELLSQWKATVCEQCVKYLGFTLLARDDKNDGLVLNFSYEVRTRPIRNVSNTLSE